MNEKEGSLYFYENVASTKLTEGRRLKLHTKGWGVLTDYCLESVKISHKNAGVVSVATLRVGDRSGQISCVIKGKSIGLLFGLSVNEWVDVEKLCVNGQQLFYRYFKHGISKQFNFEEKIFYNFCSTNQQNEPLVAKFRRCVNMRNKFKSDAFLDILELRKCDNYFLDLYTSQLQVSCTN